MIGFGIILIIIMVIQGFVLLATTEAISFTVVAIVATEALVLEALSIVAYFKERRKVKILRAALEEKGMKPDDVKKLIGEWEYYDANNSDPPPW